MVTMIRKHARKPGYSEICGFHRLSYGNAIRLSVPTLNDDGEFVEECIDSEEDYEDEDWEWKGIEPNSQ